MKKAIIITVVILAILATFWLARKVKDDGADKKVADVKLPPAATPPIVSAGSGIVAAPQSGLYSTTTGTGGAAVEKRMAEISANPTAISELRETLPVSTEIFKGVEYIAPFLLTNIAQSTAGAGVEKLPLLLTSQQRTAVKTLSELTYKGPGYWPTLERVVNACKSVLDTTGVRLLVQDMYNPKDLNNIRNYVVITLIRKDAIRNGKYDTGRLTDGTEKLVSDISTFGRSWYALSQAMQTAVKERAIADLRQSGWRFTGYDSPV